MQSTYKELMRLKRKNLITKWSLTDIFPKEDMQTKNKDMKRCSMIRKALIIRKCKPKNQNGTDEPSFSAGTETQA